MTSATIANFEKLLDGPRDGALLRYSLGNEWLKAGDPGKAASCFREALERDGTFSAAWKLLGNALAAAGDTHGALASYTQGASIAEKKGDLQAAKEMLVFAKRMRKKLGEEGS